MIAFDLGQYAEEVDAFAELAERFVDSTSALRLSEVARELQGFVAAGTHVIDWQTRQNIVFRHSNLYDGPGKHHRDTWLELGFECRFERPARTKKKSKVWNIGRAVSHLTLRKEESQLSCHFDCKNVGQWGPQIHFQIKETRENGFLPIPRIASLSFLPTDCADLGLAELHPEEWRMLQSSGAMSHHTSFMRAAQEQRSLTYLADIAKQWKDDKKATRICMLQDYTSNIRSLPDRHGRKLGSDAVKMPRAGLPPQAIDVAECACPCDFEGHVYGNSNHRPARRLLSSTTTTAGSAAGAWWSHRFAQRQDATFGRARRYRGRSRTLRNLHGP